MAGKRKPTKYTKEIGLRVLLIRKKSELNGVVFSALLGLTPSKLSDIENGHSAFGADLIFQIAKKAKVSPAWLLTGEGEMEKKEE